ncbi:hypothetical protein FKP32DRAFT_1594848 [Trametes sanguinea]|nr:hypothetical protein FKP32DRAFT_1594848 [Trametes sanguinea]
MLGSGREPSPPRSHHRCVCVAAVRSDSHAIALAALDGLTTLLMLLPGSPLGLRPGDSRAPSAPTLTPSLSFS